MVQKLALFGFVFRIAYCVLRIALGELGLFGFVLALFFSSFLVLCS